MTLAEVRAILGCRVLCGEEKLDTEVLVACGSDLMSDVLAFIKPGALLLTGLATAQSVRTADVADSKAVVYVRGKEPEEDTVQLARAKGIPLLSTDYTMFEACGRLYAAGLPGG
jgi:predicted transcriptional regulator